MNLFEQIINQSKLGTPWQFSGGTSFGSINSQDFQSKAPTIQKSVQAEQNLRNQGFSDKEVKFLKLQKEKWVDMSQAFAFVEQKRKEEAQIKNAPTTFDMTWWAVSQVPKALWETASWMSNMWAYTPMAMASAAIKAPFSEKTYWQLREEQKNAWQVFADIGQKGKEAIQSTWLYNPNSTGAKIGETITDIGTAFVWPNKVRALKTWAEVIGAGKKLTTAAKIGDIALEWGLAWAKYDVATKGEITPESVALGAIGNVWVSGVLKWGKVLAKRYTWANISTRANRFTAWDEEKFIKMTWETPWEFATTRGMTAVWEDAVKQSSQFYKASMDKADDALSKIDGSFSTKWQTDDILWDLMEWNIAKIKAQPRNPDASRINALYAKYESGQWLTMSEINEAKRIYARNHKFTWDQRASDSAVNATNLQNDLRKWQMKLAEESGLENLAEINKTTQAWKAFADSLEKRLDRSWANNLVSLSDWVALSWGNPTNLALFAGKKAFEIPWVKQWAIKLFSKQTKPSIIEPTTEKILKTNLQKKYANPSVSDSVSTISDKSLVRPVALLPAPSWKATWARNIRVNQPKDTSRKIIEKVNKEKVKRPWTTSKTWEDIVVKMAKDAERASQIKWFKRDIAKATDAARYGGTWNTRIESAIKTALEKKQITKQEAIDIVTDIYDEVSSWKKTTYNYIDLKNLEKFLNSLYGSP